MWFIGITGGVGAGKTEVLSWLAAHCSCRILPADEVGNELKLPGQPCFEPLVGLLGEGVLGEDGCIDRQKMAARIFADPGLLEQVNRIIHPEVKRYILREVERERREGCIAYFFLEAALLIEEGYGKLVDELWYIHADEAVRRQRLKESRGYSDEKVSRIMASQLPEEEFYRSCSVVIENNGDRKLTWSQLERALSGRKAQE